MAMREKVLSKLDFPLYCLQAIGKRHILVSGGGGSAKTGITNAIDIFELYYEDGQIMSRKVTHISTESSAAMNAAIHQKDNEFDLAVGLDGKCKHFNLRYKVITPKVENEAFEGLRRRRNNLTNSTNHRMASKLIGFNIQSMKEITTDHSADGGYQKVVRFTNSGESFYTAGGDGFVRLWETKNMSLTKEKHAHDNEIDDLDLNPNNSKLVTVGKDGKGYVWSSDLSTKQELLYQSEFPSRFRNCRFATVVDKPNTDVLFTTHIATVRSKQNTSSQVVKWNTTTLTVQKNITINNDIISCLAIRDDGIFLAIGTISGAIDIFISHSLQRLRSIPHAHSIFVTGLHFLSAHEESKLIGGHSEFSLFSISADNMLKVYQQEISTSYSIIWILIAIVFLIVLAMWILSSLDI